MVGWLVAANIGEKSFKEKPPPRKVALGWLGLCLVGCASEPSLLLAAGEKCGS